jgi:menaquinone-specific isochorismate synthase
VVTSEFDANAPLLDFLPDSDGMLFQQRGHGVVGIGLAATAVFSGPDRFSEAAAWWEQLCTTAKVTDSINRPGTGLAAFAQFTFSDHSAKPSVVAVPEIIIGRDPHGWWITRIGSTDSTPQTAPGSGEVTPSVLWSEGRPSHDEYRQKISSATNAINEGELHKVVLAREVVGTAANPISLRHALSRLAEAYPDTHLFSMNGFFGASPETLASVRENTLSMRVLAGSTSRGVDDDSDRARVESLATSQKDLDEHGFAVAGVLEALQEAGLQPIYSDQPHTIKLRNLWHLATDVKAALGNNHSVFETLGQLHPTPAVAGTPVDAALETITQSEPFDRGYFAGPIGWLDGSGNAEFALALRCAELSEDQLTVTAHAGAGVVKDSDPDRELLETELKLRPIIEALS